MNPWTTPGWEIPQASATDGGTCQGRYDDATEPLSHWIARCCRRFTDRTDAGRALVQALSRLPMAAPLLVLGLPGGGVPVAAEVALGLHAPLDLMLVSPLKAHAGAEQAFAAVTEDFPDEPIFTPDAAALEPQGNDALASEAEHAREDLRRWRTLHRNGRERCPVEGATVILVDDGLDSEARMRAALVALRRRGPQRLVVALPVAACRSVVALSDLADDVVCLVEPRPFHGIGLHYLDYHRPSDQEVHDALTRANAPEGARQWGG